jgi:hypothetical protein
VRLFPHILSAVDTEIPDVRDKQIWLLERAASPNNRLWADGDLDQVPDRVAKLVTITETIFGEDDIKVAEFLRPASDALEAASRDDHTLIRAAHVARNLTEQAT